MTNVRSTEEIVARIEVVRTGWFEFQSGDLIPWLPFEHAKAYLKEGVSSDEWEAQRNSGDPLEDVREYLPFAWDKANNCRGLSAGRSVDHMKAWLFLAGFDLDDELDRIYERYGKPCLVVASVIVGFPWRDHDDGDWVNEEDGPPLPTDRREELVVEAHRIAAKAMQANKSVSA